MEINGQCKKGHRFAGLWKQELNQRVGKTGHSIKIRNQQNRRGRNEIKFLFVHED